MHIISLGVVFDENDALRTLEQRINLGKIHSVPLLFFENTRENNTRFTKDEVKRLIEPLSQPGIPILLATVNPCYCTNLLLLLNNALIERRAIVVSYIETTSENT